MATNPDDWQVVAGSGSDTSAVYQRSGAFTPGSVSIAGDPSWDDVVMEARINVNAFAGASANDLGGICARVSLPGDYYLLALRADGRVDIRLVSSYVETTLASTSAAVITANTWYAVRLSAVGTNLTAYLNGNSDPDRIRRHLPQRRDRPADRQRDSAVRRRRRDDALTGRARNSEARREEVGGDCVGSLMAHHAPKRCPPRFASHLVLAIITSLAAGALGCGGSDPLVPAHSASFSPVRGVGDNGAAVSRLHWLRRVNGGQPIVAMSDPSISIQFSDSDMTAENDLVTTAVDGTVS